MTASRIVSTVQVAGTSDGGFLKFGDFARSNRKKAKREKRVKVGKPS
jgi:hypothetical protein